MRRFLILTFATLSLSGFLMVGCGSNNDDANQNVWNDKNPWGEHRSPQNVAATDPGTASAQPPTTQPSK